MKPLRVAVGLSGGVDSAMTAHLLKQEGHEVIGLTMQTWDGSLAIPDEGRSGCYGPGESRDIAAAKEAAARLGIPHHTVGLADEYRRTVLDHFREEYRAGRTPNPCVRCNQRVKFGALWDGAARLGLALDRFATGHYARVERSPESGRFLLKRGTDRTKDQSYFLSGLSQEQLGRLLLPLGRMDKRAVKALAQEAGWEDYAAKPESQDFLESRHYGALFAAADSRPGPILDLAGRVVGEHKGIVNYTVGQRKGVGLAGGPAPLYVVKIDACANAVTVGPKEALFSGSLRALEVNWIPVERPPEGGLRLQVQIRQRHEAAPALVVPAPDGRSAEAVFDQPQMSVTPGQTAVFYDGDAVCGSGTIA
ncbi:MAG TPA: tRNA 2-thiouridine(34) synthase MnmA [Elusimicrobia bacterium]|nr:tRNA 2-thiouridine(34) synthase MnmA [Elusimicrobiota bacterium]